MGKRSWHILRVKAGHEFEVASIFSCFNAYLPVATSKRVNRRTRATHIAHFPVFSGYVFIHLEGVHSLDLSSVASKVHGFLRNGQKTPLTLSEADIEWMMRLEEDMYKAPVDDAKAMFQIGQRVSFKKLEDPTGALKGIIKRVYKDHVEVDIGGPFKPLKVQGDSLHTLSSV